MTRAEIRVQINQLNKELSSTKSEYMKSKNLKSDVQQIINLLGNCLNSLYSAKDYIRKGFGNDTSTTPFKNTENCIQRVAEKKQYLESKIMWGIDNQISNLNQQLTQIQTKLNNLWNEYKNATE